MRRQWRRHARCRIIAPEAARGGPIALLHEGDRIVIDAARRESATDADLAARRAGWQPPAPKVSRGALAKYALLVGSASDGATTHPGSNQIHSAVSTPKHIHTESNQGVTA